MIDVYREFGRNVRKYRKAKNYSTAELAKRLNVSVGLINNIENAKNDVFKLNLLIKLIDILNVSLSDLLQHNLIKINVSEQAENIQITFKEINNSCENKNLIINSLVKITESFIDTISMYSYDKNAIEIINKHILNELNLFKELHKTSQKFPSL